MFATKLKRPPMTTVARSRPKSNIDTGGQFEPSSDAVDMRAMFMLKALFQPHRSDLSECSPGQHSISGSADKCEGTAKCYLGLNTGS